ncbi:MAG: DMT family transporter [Rubrivivax sp.]|nr:MAG: DMT family transporter [Rubrivivax sp.]
MTFSSRTLLFLTLPPLMWAGNAVVGRLLVGHLPPVLMNAVRWALVALVLAPLAWRALQDTHALRNRWPNLAVTGLLGVGSYNTLQYLALQTSSPLNVTLIGSSMPMWMMLVGAVGFGQRVSMRQAGGAALSSAGVLLVMSQGRWEVLRHVHLVPGDLLMLLAALAWSVYSWLLARPPASMQGQPAWNWAEFLWLQVLFGVVWAGACSGVEAALHTGPMAWPWQTGHVWTVVAGMAFIVLGPSIVAYRCWGLGVQAVGPTVAAFFSNLTPVFAAVWAWALLGLSPQWYHPLALLLIAAGIGVSSAPSRSKPARAL